jgi:hypothetical protein
MFAIISAILVFEELIVLLIMVLKIRKPTVPAKMRFIERRYGAELERRMHMMNSNLQSM